MKRILIAAMLLLPSIALAQPAPGPQGKCMFSTNCATSAQFGTAACCYDTNRQWFYYWDATSKAFLPNGNHVTVANLPSCAAGINGLQQLVTDSTSVASEGQTC